MWMSLGCPFCAWGLAAAGNVDDASQRRAIQAYREHLEAQHPECWVAQPVVTEILRSARAEPAPERHRTLGR